MTRRSPTMHGAPSSAHPARWTKAPGSRSRAHAGKAWLPGAAAPSTRALLPSGRALAPARRRRREPEHRSVARRRRHLDRGDALSGARPPLRRDRRDPSRGAVVGIRPGGAGAACAAASSCTSGFCVDGVCCEEACAGGCESCRGADTDSGVDGQCRPITAGIDPRDACPSEAASTCGKTGVCDGAGRCATYPDGTECADGWSCRDTSARPGSASTTTPSSTGTRRWTVRRRGARFELGGCISSCTTNLDCLPGFACAANGACGPNPAEAPSSCACDVPGDAPDRAPRTAAAAGLAMLIGAGRRRRRKRT